MTIPWGDVEVRWHTRAQHGAPYSVMLRHIPTNVFTEYHTDRSLAVAKGLAMAELEELVRAVSHG